MSFYQFGKDLTPEERRHQAQRFYSRVYAVALLVFLVVFVAVMMR